LLLRFLLLRSIWLVHPIVFRPFSFRFAQIGVSYIPLEIVMSLGRFGAKHGRDICFSRVR
jgi:hypothetical protein